MIEVEVANRQQALPIDAERLAEAIRIVLSEAGVSTGVVSIAVVDDREIHALNRRHLNHDYPTDVLSFLLDRDGDRLEGEIIVSADTAQAAAPRFGWSPSDELLLYVIHGALHLVGYDDHTPEDQVEMRRQESAMLAKFGKSPHNETGDGMD
jgi:probable rRNA maturation factor